MGIIKKSIMNRLKIQLIKYLIKYPMVFRTSKSVYTIITMPWKIINQNKKKYTNALLLNTMPKSGSHYLMSILANYFNFKFLSSNSRLGFLEMKELIWDVNNDSNTLKIIEKYTGFNRFFFQHENKYIKYNNAKKIILLFRNPLDLLISRFYYFYKNRLYPEMNIQHPRELINDYIKRFAYHYKYFNKMQNRNNVILVQYEDLIRYPLETTKKIFNFMEIEYDERIVMKAVDASKKENVKKDEKKYHVEGSNVIGANMKESFVRSGKIGEWKEYFSENDIERIDKILKKEGISLSQFILE